MIAVITLLVALTLTLVITRVATVALTLTGISVQSARFQARSALTGVGFTTRESESIVNHPVRRRIVLWLMLVGNAGIVTVMASLMASFVNAESGTFLDWVWNFALLGSGLALLTWIANSKWIDRQMFVLIEWALRRFTRVDVQDYAALFRLGNGFAIAESLVTADDWLADKTLIELNLPAEGVLILGIQRQGGMYVGAPTGTTEIKAGDTLILYGAIDRLDELDARKADRAGAAARRAAVIEQKQMTEEQTLADSLNIEKQQPQQEESSPEETDEEPVLSTSTESS